MQEEIPPPRLKIAGIYIVWDNKLLIHKRSGKAGSEASWHKFASPGGKVDPEDKGSFRRAALRELKEETGLVGSGKKLFELFKQSSPGADSVMYYVKYSEKPIVRGPDASSQKSVDMDFDFEKAGVKGEVAGPGYYWADLSGLLGFLKANDTYSNPYFVKNVRRLLGKLKRRGTMKKDK